MHYKFTFRCTQKLDVAFVEPEITVPQILQVALKQPSMLDEGISKCLKTAEVHVDLLVAILQILIMISNFHSYSLDYVHVPVNDIPLNLHLSSV